MARTGAAFIVAAQPSLPTNDAGRYDFQTGSDCEVILALYHDKGIDFLEDISGIFAFALYDEEKDAFLIVRDPIGVYLCI